jgi:peptide/nickel transport system substrate-binding protein
MRSPIATVRRARKLGGGSRRSRALVACFAAAGLAVTVAACGAGTDPAGGNATLGTSTATWAVNPASPVDYIFPFLPAVDNSVYNVNDFQYLMYRPLYWFGKGTGPLLNPGLSLAYLPQYHGQQVTIRLKRNYKWSNGERVDAKDLLFWLYMMQAESANWADFIPGGIPANVTDIHAVGNFEVQMTVKGPYSEAWFTNNQLSQLTPMPQAWDITGPGRSSNCAGGDLADCRAVYSYLIGQASKPDTSFGSNPLWQIVDGPWRLQSISAGDVVTLLFNKKYSGKLPPHHITKFIEYPFTSEQAEYNVLQDPSSSTPIDVGYLPTVDAPPPSGSGLGSNPDTMSDYNITTQYIWQLSYFPYNWTNTSGQAPIIHQLYFRTAFQDLVDQEGVIDGPLHGYGKPTIGPVGDYPVTGYLSPQLLQAGDRWTLNIPQAKSLLRSNGWAIKNGVQTCVHPGSSAGDCGAHIAAGTQLKFSLIYATGTDWMESAVKELVSNAALAGITVTARAEAFDTVVGTATTSCAHGCSWDMAFWGSWTYAPDYLPTGDQLFLGGSPYTGWYNNAKDDQLIEASLHARTTNAQQRAMWTWENYLAPKLPVVYEPDAPQLIETIKGLHTGPMNSALDITPEDWYWQK